MSSGVKQVFLLKIPAKQDIIARSEAKTKSSNWTPGGMKDTNKLVQGYLASILCDRRLYRQDIGGKVQTL